MSKQKSTKNIIPNIVKIGKLPEKEKDRGDNKNLKLTTIIVIILIIMILLSGYSFAKMIENTIINTNTNIAEPILVVENNPSIDITATKNHGIYSFKIKNYNEHKITDVDLKYYIEILTDVDESVNFKLYEDERQIKLENKKTDYIEISRQNKEEREYKLEITYNKSMSVSDILQDVQIKVHTEQVKA